MKYCNMQILESILCHHVDVFAGKNIKRKFLELSVKSIFKIKVLSLLRETLAVFSEIFFNQTEI